jgi:glucose-1-phosphate thymidylyltransferase
MKAILLTGGRGTRLRPLTHTKNKHALPIANKPLIMYPFMDIVEAGIKEIGVIVNETREEIEAILGDGSQWGVKVTYIFQDRPGGLAHALSLGEEFVGKSKFVMVLGDNMLQKGIKKYVDTFQNSQAHAHLLGIKVPITEHKRLGMATINDKNEVVAYIEKPGVVDKSDLYIPEKSYAVPGFYFADENIFKCFKGEGAIQPSDRGELEIPHAYNWLIHHDYTVTLEEVEGWWKDPGKHTDLIGANHFVLETLENNIKGAVVDSDIEGKIELGEDSVIENSVVRGPVTIGHGCKIRNSYIGPFTSISNNCEVSNSEVENSVIFADTKIIDLNTRLDNSIIGYNAIVTSKDKKPRNLNLVIGDNSEVRLP